MTYASNSKISKDIFIGINVASITQFFSCYKLILVEILLEPSYEHFSSKRFHLYQNLASQNTFLPQNLFVNSKIKASSIPAWNVYYLDNNPTKLRPNSLLTINL